MAILRCYEQHQPVKGSHYRAFVHSAKETACEVPGCPSLGAIWLDPEEQLEYRLGSRVFWSKPPSYGFAPTAAP